MIGKFEHLYQLVSYIMNVSNGISVKILRLLHLFHFKIL